MDADLRAAFERIESALTRFDSKLESVRAMAEKHAVSCAGCREEVLASTKSAHHRIDEHLTAHRDTRLSLLGLWITAGLGLAGWLWNRIVGK